MDKTSYKSMDSVDHLIDISGRADNARSSKSPTNDASNSINSPCKSGTAFLSQSTYSILVGQVLSILIASTGAATTLLNQYTGNSVMPAAQNCPNYIIMSLFLLYSPTRTYFGCSGGRNVSKDSVESASEATSALAPLSPESPIKIPDGRSPASPSEGMNDVWWRYALLACVDVEANVVAVWAYNYTSITSAMLLDCATIPFVMLLSWLMLGAHYSWRHFAGALLCFCGVLTIVLSDMLDGSTSTNDDDPYPMAWFGDLLCIASAFLYAVSNVTQETWVRSSAGPPRFLGRLGVCGAVLSCVQALIFERHALFGSSSGQAPLWRNGPGLLAWAAYTCALSAAYALTSWFLVGADAALFNLSLLTADVYAVLFAWFAEGVAVSPLYGVAFACTMAGLTVYHRAPAATSTASRAAAAAAAIASQLEAGAEIDGTYECACGGPTSEGSESDTTSIFHSN